MYWFGVLFATIGAGAILAALTFVSTLAGVLITAMILLFAGPVIDRFLPAGAADRGQSGPGAVSAPASGVVASRKAAS